MPSQTELAQLLEDNDLSIFKDYLLSTLTQCYTLEPKGEAMDDLPIAMSKVGGLPHLPENFVWPSKGRRPLMFLAQINLEQINPDHVPDNPLPRSGLLTFWADTAGLPWGFDPKDNGGYQVHYISDPIDSLEMRELPPYDADGLEEEPQYPWTPFNECELQIKDDNCFDANPESVIDAIRSSISESDEDELCERFMDFIEAQGEESEGIHQLLGLPYQIQGDMRTECQLVSNGIYLGNQPPESENAKIESLKPGAKDWRLLLQLDSDYDAADWMWGDCGKLYYWIKDEDLRNADFSKGWCVLQCY